MFGAAILGGGSREQRNSRTSCEESFDVRSIPCNRLSLPTSTNEDPGSDIIRAGVMVRRGSSTCLSRCYPVAVVVRVSGTVECVFDVVALGTWAQFLNIYRILLAVAKP